MVFVINCERVECVKLFVALICQVLLTKILALFKAFLQKIKYIEKASKAICICNLTF